MAAPGNPSQGIPVLLLSFHEGLPFIVSFPIFLTPDGISRFSISKLSKKKHHLAHSASKAARAEKERGEEGTSLALALIDDLSQCSWRAS